MRSENVKNSRKNERDIKQSKKDELEVERHRYCTSGSVLVGGAASAALLNEAPHNSAANHVISPSPHTGALLALCAQARLPLKESHLQEGGNRS